MKRTVLNLTSDLPVYSAQRRTWVGDQQRRRDIQQPQYRREARRHDAASLNGLTVAWICVGLLVTACLLAAWAEGWFSA